MSSRAAAFFACSYKKHKSQITAAGTNAICIFKSRTFQALRVRLCAGLAGTTWKTHVQKYLCHFPLSERDWDYCRRDALHIQGKADRWLPFTILPPSLPSGSCRRMLSTAKQGKSYQAVTKVNQSPEWRSNVNQKFTISFLVTATFIHHIATSLPYMQRTM